MNEICEVRNSIRDIKAKKDVHSEQVKDNKRRWNEHKAKKTIINYKLRISNDLKIPKANQILQKTVILYYLKNMHAENLTIIQNQQIYYHQVAISYWSLLLILLN